MTPARFPIGRFPRPTRAGIGVPCAMFLLLLFASGSAGAAADPAAPAPAGPTGKVVGKVLASDTGEALIYANVVLVPADTTIRRIGQQSNADGSFTLKAPPGTYRSFLRR